MQQSPTYSSNPEKPASIAISLSEAHGYGYDRTDSPSEENDVAGKPFTLTARFQSTEPLSGDYKVRFDVYKNDKFLSGTETPFSLDDTDKTIGYASATLTTNSGKYDIKVTMSRAGQEPISVSVSKFVVEPPKPEEHNGYVVIDRSGNPVLVERSERQGVTPDSIPLTGLDKATITKLVQDGSYVTVSNSASITYRAKWPSPELANVAARTIGGSRDVRKLGMPEPVKVARAAPMTSVPETVAPNAAARVSEGYVVIDRSGNPVLVERVERADRIPDAIPLTGLDEKTITRLIQDGSYVTVSGSDATTYTARWPSPEQADLAAHAIGGSRNPQRLKMPTGPSPSPTARPDSKPLASLKSLDFNQVGGPVGSSSISVNVVAIDLDKGERTKIPVSKLSLRPVTPA